MDRMEILQQQGRLTYAGQFRDAARLPADVLNRAGMPLECVGRLQSSAYHGAVAVAAVAGQGQAGGVRCKVPNQDLRAARTRWGKGVGGRRVGAEERGKNQRGAVKVRAETCRQADVQAACVGGCSASSRRGLR